MSVVSNDNRTLGVVNVSVEGGSERCWGGGVSDWSRDGVLLDGCGKVVVKCLEWLMDSIRKRSNSTSQARFARNGRKQWSGTHSGNK